MHSVERVLAASEITPLPGSPRTIAGVINAHGFVTPVLDLRRRVCERTSTLRVGDRFILVRTPARLVAVIADEVLDVVDVGATAIASLEPLVPGLGRLEAAATADGLIYIYSADSLLSPSEESALASILDEA